MANQSEKSFLTNLRERKRRCDISQALKTKKSRSFLDLDDLQNTLIK